MKALIIKDLKKTYSNGVEALKGINLEVEEGEFFGLLGPNGAGKSTTIGIITSLVNKTSGSIQIFNCDLASEPTKAKRAIGLVPQEFNFNVFEKCTDILTQQAGYYGIPRRQAIERAAYYLNKLGLSSKANHPAKTLSGGQKRRLMIARGLIHEPKLLILDEPTAGVDIELRRETWSFLQEINQKGITIILTTHYLEEAETLCRRVAIINHGEIIEDMGVKQLLSKLDKETIILDLRAPIPRLPQASGCEISALDDTTIEVSYHRNTGLNELFKQISELGGDVISMRNKANRLEELFLDLVKTKV